MAKAPYVRPRMRGQSRVFDIRPTTELLKAFPDLVRETYTTSTEANARGYELKRRFEAYKSGRVEDVYVDDRSVEAMIKHYLASTLFINLPSQNSKRSYLHHINYLQKVNPTNTPFAKKIVSEVDYDYAQNLWLHIQDDISTHKANHCVKVLKRIWKLGVKSGRAKANVWREIELPKLADRQVMWDIDQITGMIKHCDEQGYPSMGTMITMCYEFCQRPVDVRNMKWSNIDGRTGVSNFIQQKTNKQMSIKVTNAVQKRLHLHSKRNSDDYIFHYEDTGRPFSGDRCNKLFRKLADSYGLPEVPLHRKYYKNGSQRYSSIWLADLRRTGATHASRAGCTDRELMALTGHRNPQMLVVYAVEGEIESTNANLKRGLL